MSTGGLPSPTESSLGTLPSDRPQNWLYIEECASASKVNKATHHGLDAMVGRRRSVTLDSNSHDCCFMLQMVLSNICLIGLVVLSIFTACVSVCARTRVATKRPKKMGAVQGRLCSFRTMCAGSEHSLHMACKMQGAL